MRFFSALSASGIRSRLAQMAYLPRALRLVREATPVLSLVWTVLLVVQGLVPAATVYLTRPLVNSVARLVGAGLSMDVIRPFLLFAGLMATLMLVSELIDNAIGAIRGYQVRVIEDHISGLIHTQSMKVDLAFYETPDYHDHLYRARDMAGSSALALLENAGGMLRNGVSLLGLAVVIIPYGWWLPLVLVASTLPVLVVVVRHQWRRHLWYKATTTDRRWANYYDWILTWAEAAPELRLFGWGPFFRETYQTIRLRLRKAEMTLLKDQFLSRLVAVVFSLLLVGGTMAWMIYRAVHGQATLGDLALFYQAFSRGQSLLQGLLTSAGQIFSNILFISHLYEFLGLESRIADPPDPIPVPEYLHKGIRFRDITFLYPGSERAALRDFNLFVPAGRTIAIVGSNGAGKSTLIKLLCRFYDPQSGTVEVDGADVRRYTLRELRRLFTVMFQTPVPYHASVADNIAIGDFEAQPTREQIVAAARASGADEVIGRLPQGYDTLLGKWFVNGTELSGGERQRLALARAFLRNSPVVVLDEPTSFMDSWAETEWLDRFRSLVAGRTAVIITHRFTTAMRADVIHVMEEGRIVESGTHDELMALEGRYAASWSAQMHASRKQVPATE